MVSESISVHNNSNDTYNLIESMTSEETEHDHRLHQLLEELREKEKELKRKEEEQIRRKKALRKQQEEEIQARLQVRCVLLIIVMFSYTHIL